MIDDLCTYEVSFDGRLVPTKIGKGGEVKDYGYDGGALPLDALLRADSVSRGCVRIDLDPAELALEVLPATVASVLVDVDVPPATVGEYDRETGYDTRYDQDQIEDIAAVVLVFDDGTRLLAAPAIAAEVRRWCYAHEDRVIGGAQ